MGIIACKTGKEKLKANDRSWDTRQRCFGEREREEKEIGTFGFDMHSE